MVLLKCCIYIYIYCVHVVYIIMCVLQNVGRVTAKNGDRPQTTVVVVCSWRWSVVSMSAIHT